MKKITLACIFLFIPLLSDAAPFCSRYKAPKQIGALDPNFIPESSGLAISRKFLNRLYHHNDSGDEANFYLTDFSGAQTKKIEILGHKAKDMEDMAIGPCANGKSCLFFGDIGDNKTKRDSITLLMVEELENFPAQVNPIKKINLQYPDRSHNAESLVVHPNGDVFILTKEFSEKNLQVAAAQVFKVSASQIAASSEAAITLSFMGELDIPYLNHNLTEFGQILTAADISSDGSKIITLTYENALEFQFDLNKKFLPAKDMKKGIDYEAVSFPALLKQEAIAYLPGDKTFLYTSESEDFGILNAAPIMKLECEETK